MPPNTPEHQEGKEAFSQQIEKSIDDRIRELQYEDKQKGQVLQNLKSAIVEKIVMPTLDDKGQITGSKLDDLRLDEGEMGQVFDLLQKDPTVKDLLEKSGMKTADDFMVFIGMREIASDRIGMQNGPANLKEDANVFAENGKIMGLIFRNEKVQIADATPKTINGELHVLVTATHDLGRYRPKYAGQTKNYTGYIPIRCFQGNLKQYAPQPQMPAPAPKPIPEPTLRPQPIPTPEPAPRPQPAPTPQPTRPEAPGTTEKPTSYLDQLSAKPTAQEAANIQALLLNTSTKLSAEGKKELATINGPFDELSAMRAMGIREKFQLNTDLKVAITEEQFASAIVNLGKSPSPKPAPTAEPKPASAAQPEPTLEAHAPSLTQVLQRKIVIEGYFQAAYNHVCHDFDEAARLRGYENRQQADQELSILTGTQYGPHLKSGDPIKTPDGKEAVFYKTARE